MAKDYCKIENNRELTGKKVAKFEKGQSGNPSGRPPKVEAPQGRILAHGIFAEATGVPALPIEKTKADRTLNTNYKCIPFGSDNLFPQALAKITRRSPVHRSIIYWKTMFMTGDSFICQDDKVKDFIKDVNNKDESLRKVNKKQFFDWNTFGNVVEVYTKYKNGFLVEHVDFTKCRVKDVDKSTNKTPAILIHPNWAKEPTSRDLTVEIPLYPNFNSKGQTAVHYKDYEPEFDYYGLPCWVAAMDVAAIGWKTNKWNISRLDNSFRPSGVLLIQGNITPDEAKELIKNLKEQKTGEGNTGGILSIVQESGSDATTTFTEFTTTDDGDWTKLHTQANTDLVSAHNWQKSLCNQTAIDGIGNTTLIRNEYGLALVTIKDSQAMFTETWTKMFKAIGGLDASTLTYVNKNPAPVTDKLDPSLIMTEDEQRAAFGLDPMTPEQRTKFIEEQSLRKSNGTNNSTGSNKP